MIAAATAAVALFALVAMHGLPFTGTTPAAAPAAAAVPAAASHHAAASGDMAAAMTHDHDPVAAMPAAPAAPVSVTSDDAGSTALHAHSVWHLCLAVLVAVAGIALAVSVGRRITDVIPRVRGRLVRVLESRALDPPTQAGLCLLRC